jgi:hypothetical protein
MSKTVTLRFIILLPYASSLGVKRDQLGIEGGEIDVVVIDGDATVVGSAA